MTRKVNLLTADAGGTHIRLGYVDVIAAPELLATQNFMCAEFDSVEDAIRHYCQLKNISPRHATIAVAGPVVSDEFVFTNNPWRFSQRAIKRNLDLESFFCVNDFTAQAWGIHALMQQDIPVWQEQSHASISCVYGGDTNTNLNHGNVLITGPGTGLGVATLYFSNNDQAQVIAGEGGHVAISAQTPEEITLLQWLIAQNIPPVAENIISGQGLENLYRFLSGGQFKQAIDIGSAALLGEETALKSVMMMFSQLGVVCANAALTINARRGIVITGGIGDKLAPLLVKSDFLHRLHQHAAMSDILRSIPIYVCHDSLIGLRGAAEAFRRQ